MIEQFQQLLTLLLDDSAVMIGIKNPDGVYWFANKEYEKLFKRPAQEIIGKTDHDLFPSEVAGLLRRNDQEAITSGKSVTTEEEIQVGGQAHSYLSVKFPIYLEGGTLVASGVVAMDISDRKRSEAEMENALKSAEQINAELKTALQELERLASTDRLTNAWNRRRFEEAAHNEIYRAQRFQHPVSLILFDIDHFKRVNDGFGHPAGDRVLVGMAKIAMQALRQADCLARWGGEEFVVLAPNTTLSGASVLAEKLRSQIELYDFPKVGRVSASFGVAEYQTQETYEDWIQRADQALYKAKQTGRNRVEADPATALRQIGGEHIEGHFIQLVWRDNYCCGQPLIDQQHQQLFQDANELLTAVLSARPRDEIAALVNRLLADVACHFRDEEEILKACGYPEAAQHAQSHAKLTREADKLAEAFAAGTLSVGSLFQFLAYDVITLHMLRADRAFFPYLPSGSTPDSA